ncbi:transposase [Nostocales cyanobacterium LEGE 12452]|nr:transposase [Nostocales cyanobacterium LEGE 12452]
MVKWFSEIVCYFDGKIISGTVKEINNKLRLIKILGCGFRDFRNFGLPRFLHRHFTINFPQKWQNILKYEEILKFFLIYAN